MHINWLNPTFTFVDVQVLSRKFSQLTGFDRSATGLPVGSIDDFCIYTYVGFSY